MYKKLLGFFQECCQKQYNFFFRYRLVCYMDI